MSDPPIIKETINSEDNNDSLSLSQQRNDAVHEVEPSETISETDKDENKMSETPRKPEILLTNSTYDTWKYQIEAVLNREKCWLDPDGEHNVEDNKYKTAAKKAYFEIIMRCDPEHVRFVATVALYDSVKALNALKAKYEGKGIMPKMELLQQVLMLRQQNEPVEIIIDHIRMNYNKLSEKGLVLPEIVQVANLMISLSSEFGNVLSSFFQMDEDELKFENVASAILCEQRRRSMSQSNGTAAASLNRFERKKSLKCKSCGKLGHLLETCRFKSGPKCPTCHYNGHSSEKCWKNKKLQNKSGKPTSNYSFIEDNGEATDEVSIYASVHNAFAVTKPQGKLNAFPNLKRPSTVFHRLGNFPEQGAKSANKPSVKLSKKNTIGPAQSLPRTKSAFIKKNKGEQRAPQLKSVIVRVNNERQNKMSLDDYLNSLDSQDYQQTAEPPRTPGKDLKFPENDEVNLSLSDISEFELNVKEKEIASMINKSFEIYEISYFSSGNKDRIQGWIVDSGASLHMSYEKSLFSNLSLSNCGKIKIANGSFIPIRGYGKIKIFIKTQNEPIVMTLNNVAFVPDLHINLISVNELNKSFNTIVFEKGFCKVKMKDQLISIAKFENNNYLVSEDACKMASPCLHEWHRRLAHRHLRDIKHLKEFGLQITKCYCQDQCDACMRGKSVQLPFPNSIKPDEPLDVVVSDVCGPLRTQSLGGSRYFLTITDVFSDYTEVKFLRNKSEATDQIINFIEFTKTQLSKKPKVFRSDGGGEFVNIKLQNFLQAEGIKIQITTPNTPQQNGIAERKNRTLNDSVRTLLIASKLPDTLWAEAMNNVVYTQNRIIRKDKIHSPIELFFAKKARATFMEFGQQVYVTTPRQGRGKLEPHAEVMRFLSVDDNAKGFRLWNGSKIIVDRNIKPRENFKIEYKNPLQDRPIEVKTNKSVKNSPELQQTPIIKSSEDSKGSSEDENIKESPSKSSPEFSQSHTFKSSEDSNESSEDENIEEPQSLRRSKRLMDKKISGAAHISQSNDDPKTYNQAITGVNKNRWIKAMNEEIESLQQTGTYELSDLPKGRKAIGCKWVYKTKLENNSVRYKARLVAKGFCQKYGEDYDEIFSPVARSTTIRVLLSMAGKLNLRVRQFDVKTAFLNGKLDEEIYMAQPDGFKSSDKVLRLRKSLYGLKQAARSWNTMLKECLTKIKFTQSNADNCLFIKKDGTNTCYIVVHVDDMLFAATNIETINAVHTQLSQYFTLKDLGSAKQFLGVDIHEFEGHFGINQSRYITAMAEEFGFSQAKAQKYPIQPGYFKLDDDELLQTNREYRKIIGKLLYVSTNSRPDISLSVCILAQRVEKPRKLDITEALRVIKYLVNTKDYVLHLNNKHANQSLIGFSDANFGECKLDGKSNSGVICFVNGGPIVWSSKKQSLVALSTCEAEYYAITETVKEILWLQSLLEDFNSQAEMPTTILTDNQSSICMIENADFMQRTKYIGVRYHYIRDYIEKKIIKLSYCPSEYNIADMMTKPLCGTKIQFLRENAGLLPPAILPTKETNPILSIATSPIQRNQH